MNAVNGTQIKRTPKDKGNQITITITRYDNDLWSVTTDNGGEPCVDRKEVNRVVGNVINTIDKK